MNIDAILQPISEDLPCGEDLAFAPEIDQLQDMRREDDPTLDQGAWVHALKQADWPGVVALSSSLLSERTKDLRIAAWLTEALARTKGFAGMADGLHVVERLCALYWSSIHPQPDDDDQEQRIGNLAWLIKQIQMLAGTIALLQNDSGQFGVHALEQARQRLEMTNEDGKPLIEVIQSMQATIPEGQLLEVLTDIERAQTQLQTLDQTLTELLGQDGPGFSLAHEALEKAHDIAQRHVRERGLARKTKTNTAAHPAAGTTTTTTTSVATVPQQQLSSTATDNPAALQPVALQTRAQALEQLRIVAAFFRRTEPHSPVAYLADKAAKWGDMPLHEWLRIVIKDPAALDRIEEMLDVLPMRTDENTNNQ